MIKIAVAQIKNSTDLNANLENIKSYLTKLESQNIDLILFPECSLSGFSAKIGECTFEAINSYLDEINLWAKQHKTTVVLPTALKEENIYNTGFVFQDGRRERFYKIGLTDSEKGFFSIPNEYRKQVFEVRGYRFIPLICLEAQLDHDLYFSKGDVDFILWPGYWGWEEGDEWQAQKGDGDENLVYSNSSKWELPLIQSNFAFNDIGDDRSKGPHGLSIVVDKLNKCVFRGAYDKEEIFLVELEGKTIKSCYSL